MDDAQRTIRRVYESGRREICRIGDIIQIAFLGNARARASSNELSNLHMLDCELAPKYFWINKIDWLVAFLTAIHHNSEIFETPAHFW